jgi:hypothetical protein
MRIKNAIDFAYFLCFAKKILSFFGQYDEQEKDVLPNEGNTSFSSYLYYAGYSHTAKCISPTARTPCHILHSSICAN